jgi:hypothetical protein
MKFMNKKVLAAAVVGLLASGNALAAAEIQTANTIYAKEIALPATLTVPVEYQLGYNFNTNETRYACVRLDGAQFPSGAVATPTISNLVNATDLTAGVVNKVGNNVVFFTLSSDPAAAIGATHDAIVELTALSISVNSYAPGAVTASVGLYDNPAAAGACAANNQLIPDTWDQKPLVDFKPSFSFTTDPNKAIASVENAPVSFAGFKYPTPAGGYVSSDADHANLATAKLTMLTYGTPAIAPLTAAGTPITPAVLFKTTAPTDTVLKIDGDFGDWLVGTEFNAVAPTAQTVASASWEQATLAALLAGADFTVEADSTSDEEISIGGYLASLKLTPNTGYTLGAGNGVAATVTPSFDGALVTGDNDVDSYNEATAGQISQDGVRLMTPLVQLAGGDWLARIAISNTGTKDRDFTLKVQGFDSEGQSSTVTTPNVTYTVKAGTTYVFDNLANQLNFTGRARGTVTAIVAAPETEVKGVYQLVNTSANTISNINMINVNGGQGH